MEIVERVRQVSSIAEIASQYTTLKKRGRKWVGLCPFHTEKTPSFTVDEDKQLYHCFGCGVGGDVFSLIMQKEGLTFPEALKSLAEKYRVPLPQQSRLDPQVMKLEEKLARINELALGFFRGRLRDGPEGARARQYLHSRGLGEETIETLRIGYAPAAWTALLDFFRGRDVPVTLLEKGGLVLPGRKPGQFYDRFRGRVIFPIFSLTGKVVAFGGRSLGPETPKYLNSPDTPLYSKGRLLYGLNFTKDAIRDAGEAVLVEGYTDFAALYQAGIPNVAASLGTALTVDQVGQLARFARRVVVGYDGDAAGQTAIERAVPLFFESGVHVRALVFPDRLDPDAYLARVGRDAFLALMGGATGGLRFLIDRRLSGIRLEIPEEKARAARDLLREVQRVPDSIARSEHLRELSEALRLNEDEIRALAAATGPPVSKSRPSPFVEGEKLLLQMVMEDREIAAALLAEIDEAVFGGLAAEPVFRYILDCRRESRSWNFAELGTRVSPELLAQVSRALQEPIPAGSTAAARVWLDKLRTLHLEKRLREIQRRIVLSEKSGDLETLARDLKRRQELTTELHDSRLNEQADRLSGSMPGHQVPDSDV